MRTFRRIMTIALALGVLSFLIVPFLVPQPNSGTLTNVEAAGPDAQFEDFAGLSVHVDHREYRGDCKCDAPLIILMHGFGASTYSWRSVIEPLRNLGEVIAYDRPGFGFTERPTAWNGVNPYGFEGNFRIIDSIISSYGSGRKIVLVGHSAGGQLAAEYARLNPSKVSSLILVDPAILTTGGGGEGLDWLYQIPQVQKLGPILVSSIASSGDNLLRQSFYDETKLTDEVYVGYHKPLQVKGWEQAFWNFATAPRSNKLAANLPKLKMPTLLISGSSDSVVPTADTVKLSKLIPNSRLELIEKSGHLPHEELPEVFMKAILGNWPWLSSTQ